MSPAPRYGRAIWKHEIAQVASGSMSFAPPSRAKVASRPVETQPTGTPPA